MRTLPRPHRDDGLIALTGLVGGVVAIVFHLYTMDPDPDRGLLWARVPGLLLMCLAELGRRAMPRSALALAVPAVALDALVGGSLAVLVMFTDVIYASVLYGPARFGRALVHGTTVLSVATAVTLVVWLREADALLLAALIAGVLSTPAWTGLLLRERRDEAAAERLRAEQTALLAEMDRVQAVGAERARMARELHDVVANHLSVIAIHSTAALSLRRPETTEEALTVIRENSTQGLTEMRRLIGLLRGNDSDDPPEAAPSLEALGTLLTRAERSDVSGRLRFVGDDRRTPGARLPAPVELAAYRIVQESLNNAVKHAAPGEVRVCLGDRDERLAITVTSPYRTGASSRAPGFGAGLVGMTERAELLRGSFHAGPVPDASDGAVWRVEAELPLTEGTSKR
ncbi:sensor histidine kinase [Streptomyces profundus]|uniref:sensor histidine kinase n=1 Tax=Streptomyces profundus TaxID=2867410 RepID=UPI001D16363D|nr:histidine kinase [Streptomyces sp. MA3_2.13]UED84016.1 two-component sensor histidine kinase [Streptomyces sp. MA3_2.13]